MSDDSKAPLPPPNLAWRVLPILETPGPWFRIHRQGYGALYFGRTLANRFDDPEQEFGVLYVAETLDGAFIETFGRSPGINAVSERQLRSRSLTRVKAVRAPRLVDLAGPGLAWIGATSALFAGPHAEARRWSRALWAHPATPDGLLYRSRHDPWSLCAAVFDRATGLLEGTALGGLLAEGNRETIGVVLRRYDFSLRP